MLSSELSEVNPEDKEDSKVSLAKMNGWKLTLELRFKAFLCTFRGCGPRLW